MGQSAGDHQIFECTPSYGVLEFQLLCQILFIVWYCVRQDHYLQNWIGVAEEEWC